jgi:HlyD family secretion protein
MLVETQVREIDVHKIHLGQTVHITVDAYPDTQYHGVVSLIGSLARAERNLPTTAKYFETQIVIDESDDRLRPGMTARVDILVEQFDDALYIPLQAVFEKAGKQVCYVVREHGPEERLIEIGQFNDDVIVVTNGLSEGERIYLHDPTAFILR